MLCPSLPCCLTVFLNFALTFPCCTCSVMLFLIVSYFVSLCHSALPHSASLCLALPHSAMLCFAWSRSVSLCLTTLLCLAVSHHLSLSLLCFALLCLAPSLSAVLCLSLPAVSHYVTVSNYSFLSFCLCFALSLSLPHTVSVDLTCVCTALPRNDKSRYGLW